MKLSEEEHARAVESRGGEEFADDQPTSESEFMLGDEYADTEDDLQAQASSPTPLRKFYLYLAASPQAEAVCRIAGVVCALAAAALLWRGQTESAFVVAVVGVIAWFLGLRNRLRRAGIVAGARQQKERRVEEDDDEI